MELYNVYRFALSGVGPSLAEGVEVETVVLALVAGEGAALQHPARVLLAFALLGPSGTMARIKNNSFCNV